MLVCVPVLLRLTVITAASLLALPAAAVDKKSQVERKSPPRAEPVRPVRHVSPSDLELVERVFQKKKKTPVGARNDRPISELETVWQSYWWSGEDALFNTKGLVITGQTDWGPKWKPYGLIGLEEKVTFESYGKRRDAQLGIGVKYAFTDQLGSFLEFRALSSSAVPQEGVLRVGIHVLY
jgi:hypothetical protein